jgi:hypothetical protein
MQVKMSMLAGSVADDDDDDVFRDGAGAADADADGAAPEKGGVRTAAASELERHRLERESKDSCICRGGGRVLLAGEESDSSSSD